MAVSVVERLLVEEAPLLAAPVPRPRWERTYRTALVGVDGTCAALAGLLATLARYGTPDVSAAGINYRYLWLFGFVLWPLTLLVAGAYDDRVFGVGPEEYRRVASSALNLFVGITLIVFAVKVPLGRTFVALGVPLTLVLTLVGRRLARDVLHRARDRGWGRHKVLVVGASAEVRALHAVFERAGYAGLDVVGACVSGRGGGLAVPVVGRPSEAAELALTMGVDTVAVAGAGALGHEGLRRLGWALEGSGIDLLVAPALTDVAGPRLTMRPVDGMPLLHVDEPKLDGPKRALKAAIDRTLAALAVLTLLPVLVVVALVVKLSSPGPVLYRQVRVGRGGAHFNVWKFRTMVQGADARRPDANDAEGPLFKLRDDPRVTRSGSVLRRWSLDELPQLFNVLTGDMSLVGPRPPLPSEVERYGDDVARRLLVKPGLTGLWQVSGRSDLSWEESIRLDLRYVENWSVSMDFAILARTVVAVLSRRGAY